jgi:hypothetical protein
MSDMKQLLFLLLVTLGLIGSVKATRVTYAEAYYSVPEYMTEVEADGVHGYDVNPGGRSFVGRDSNGQVFISVSSYRDMSQIKDENSWIAFASTSEPRLIQELQASFIALPADTTVTVDSVKTDLRTHKLVGLATARISGTVSKLVTGILTLKNQKSLHLEIYVNSDRFEELRPAMIAIVDSLSVNPEYQLSR